MVVCMVALVPLLTNVIFPHIELYVAEKKLAAGKMEEKQEILDLLESTTIDSKKWELVQEYMIGEGMVRRFDIYISPSFTTWQNDNIDKVNFTWEEKLPFITDYVEAGPVNEYLATAASLLSSYYEGEGYIEKAKQVLFDASERFTPSVYEYNRNELLLKRIRLAKNHGQFDEANQYLEELLANLDSDNYDFLAQIAKIRVEMILQKGRINEAYEEVKKEIKKYEEEFEREKEEWEHEEDFDFGEIENRAYYEELKTLERSLSLAKGKIDAENGYSENLITVSGRIVRSDGNPMEGVGVFLRNENNASHSVRPEETYQAVTNEDGYYEFKGVIPNYYQLTLGFDFEQISGWNWPVDMNEWIVVDGSKDITYDVTLQKLIEIKSPVNQQEIEDDVVHFEWEAVKGAASYGIGLGFDIEGGSIGSGVFMKVEDTAIDIPIEDIYNITGGITYGEDNVVDPLSLLAYTNPENRLHWKVEAYDEEGKMITRSDGYRLDEDSFGNPPFFYLKQRELTEADRLLLDLKVDKSLQQYMENYKNNPNDVHSLRMIPRLIGIDARGQSAIRDDLAIPYLEDLALKSPSSNTLFQIVMYYYEQHDWDAFQKWFNLYIEIEKELNDYTQSIYASALMKQGKNTEATVHFEEAMKKDGSHRFVGHWIANELYQYGLTHKVVQIAREYPFISYGMGYGPDWLALVNGMMEEAEGYTDYNQELKQVLDLYFAGKDVKLDNWLEKTDKSAMKKIIEAVKEVN